MPRRVSRVAKSRPTVEGAGVHLFRAFGFHEVPDLDPFLLLDDFHSDDPDKYLAGFPWHPHRGIETITYVLHGNVEHGDSMGNKGVIGEGDVQWMTAGSGIIHQEMPKGDSDGLLWGFQLWANLPARDKMMDPRYRDVKDSDIPRLTLDGDVEVRIISGEVEGTKGPVQDIVIEPVYIDVSMPPGAKFVRKVPDGHTAFAYVVDGKGYFDDVRDPYKYDVEPAKYTDLERDCLIGEKSLVVFKGDGAVEVESKDEGLRFLFVSGKPIGEPVAWYGPIVMNTDEELKTAFEEYRNGTFLSHENRGGG